MNKKESKTYNQAFVNLNSIAEKEVTHVTEVVKNLTDQKSHVILSGGNNRLNEMIEIKKSLGDRSVMFYLSKDTDATLLKGLSYSRGNTLLVSGNDVSSTILTYYDLNSIEPGLNSLKVFEVKRKILNETGTVNKPRYGFAIIDYQGFTRYYLPHLIKVINLKLAPDGHIVFVVNTQKISMHDRMSAIARMFSIFLIFTDDVDKTILHFIATRPDRNLKVLVGTHVNNLITAIVTHHTPDEVGFLLDSSQGINRTRLKGYDTGVFSLLYRNEGIISHILEINNELEMVKLRNYTVPTELAEAIKSSIPCEYEKLYEIVQSKGVVSDRATFKKAIASLAAKFVLFVKKEGNHIMVLNKK